jgi:hypothetical protein
LQSLREFSPEVRARHTIVRHQRNNAGAFAAFSNRGTSTMDIIQRERNRLQLSHIERQVADMIAEAMIACALGMAIAGLAFSLAQ